MRVMRVMRVMQHYTKILRAQGRVFFVQQQRWPRQKLPVRLTDR
jgi:hypothetical protein